MPSASQADASRCDLDVVQNTPENRRLMKARQGLYLIAGRWQVAQLLVVVGLPLLGSILAVLLPSYKPQFGAMSVIITIADVLFLDRQYRRAIKTAAKGAEHFDCAVLQLPWNPLSAGAPLRPEEIGAAADQWDRHRFKLEIQNWYPVVVRFAPIHVARVICQRANVQYDSSLRRFYSLLLLLIVAALAVGILALGLWKSATLAEIVLSGLVPAAPLLIWAIREFFRQRDAAEANETIQKESEALLNRVVQRECDPATCAVQSMQLQGALFQRRASNPLLLPGVYRLQRYAQEKRMNEGAEHWVKKAGYWPANEGND